ncbi:MULTISPECIES: WxL domain-containing protein [unclassified Enterococcus]|uniref:WxL domain-containing protein n=1 Tax=Candidatus Enterococcus dunnyi TaxID=1834192 RepID=A0A200IZK5_9ENTE|nr:MULTISPECIES: WxL domain-containing protein [unclassified Enterococcus]OUZ30368.1 hypothetical protein A5889_002656 [Enterococcus sp. 9D6_DIV0238]
MKKQKFKIITSMIIMLTSLTFFSSSAQATNSSITQPGTVTVEGSAISNPIDPENPEEVVDPGEGPSTEGPLRIDYVSSLDFGKAKISGTNRTYHALAQQFRSETGPRGSYIQITDQRANSTGWTLQVKQNHQFRNTVIQNANEQELNGAVLSLDKGWANSSGTSESPTVTRETIALNSIGTAYDLATASPGSGRGVWTIAFGASETNSNNMETTLLPVVDSSGNALIDDFSGKPAYSNSAVRLAIPNATKIYPVQYATELTWILAELP